jgi:adenosylcobinamide-phosphate synthase
MYAFLCLSLALILDKVFGEAQRFHPLVGFGYLAKKLEHRLNQGRGKRLKGVFALVALLLPFAVLSMLLEYFTQNDSMAYIVMASFMLYLAIGWQSLLEHSLAVYRPLSRGDIGAARYAVSMMVSRDVQKMDHEDIAKGTTESVLENGADAIFSAIFWFLLAGVPGLVIYRLSNTLDAMWGYRNTRFTDFGWAAARLDDVLNYLPARLTAITYALCGKTHRAFGAWRSQSGNWKSPNAGPVMSAGAGALNLSLGGAAYYDGKLECRPLLGVPDGMQATAPSIVAAGQLINKSLFYWWLALLVFDGIMFIRALP